MTKTQLAEKIKRRLGHPIVKIELDDSQIFDNIDYARDKFIKWAVGNATQEVYFTIPLSGGTHLYELPGGVVEVLSYSNSTIGGSVNTLFTIDNYLYSNGLFDSLVKTTGSEYSLVSYHIARGFIKTLRRYTPDQYNFKYHKGPNLLEIQPPPLDDGTDHGFILLRTFMVTGATLGSYDENAQLQDLYSSAWVFDYSLALCKLTLGYIRRKFANFQSMGNQGVNLDGDNLVSEAKEELENLKEDLKTEEAYEGYGIEIG